MKFLYIILIAFLGLIEPSYCQIPSRYVHATDLAKRWDEGMPLGNGLMGALVWNKNERIRFALDHPYDREPAPTKIPGAAIEIPHSIVGYLCARFLVAKNSLYLILF